MTRERWHVYLRDMGNAPGGGRLLACEADYGNARREAQIAADRVNQSALARCRLVEMDTWETPRLRIWLHECGRHDYCEKCQGEKPADDKYWVVTITGSDRAAMLYDLVTPHAFGGLRYQCDAFFEDQTERYEREGGYTPVEGTEIERDQHHGYAGMPVWVGRREGPKGPQTVRIEMALAPDKLRKVEPL